MDSHKHHKVKVETGRYVETLFRVTFSNQIHLIQIADNKANSIITINALIITVLIGLSGYGSVTQTMNLRSLNLILPIILLLITCFSSVIFALMATQPRFVKTNNKRPGKSSDSLLFFGSIPERTLDAYLADMDELTHSPESVYHALETELYNQSKVLTRKYRLLRIAFLVFTFGFISSMLAFVISFLFVF